MNTTLPKTIIRYLLIAFGVALINFTYVIVTIPYGIINGGVTSLSMVLNRFPALDFFFVNIWVSIITALLALLCLIFLGRDTFIASLFSCICGILFINLFFAVIPKDWINFILALGSIGDNPLIPVGTAIELVIAAGLVGTGYFFCLSNNSTAVGLDTIALILHTRHNRIPVAYAMYAMNIIVLLLGLYTYGLRCVIMGIAFAGIQAVVLNGLLKVKGV